MENNVTKKYVWGIPADTYCPCPSPAQMEAVPVEEKRENKKHRFSLFFSFSTTGNKGFIPVLGRGKRKYSIL